MEKHVVFESCSGDVALGRKETPEFYRLYRQAVLLELKAQGVLDEAQYLCCMEELDWQTPAKEGCGCW